MGNSEARLHKMGNQKAKSNLDRAVKAMETRLEKLEVKDKPWELEVAKVEFKEYGEVVSRILVQGKNICKKFGDREIFRKAEFEILKGSKTALIGSNGSGKTTLLKLIISPNEDMDIRLANGVKIGYFSQGMDILDESSTILENVMNTSVQPEVYARTMLARLLFKRDEMYKKVGQLSGGERVRVCFAKIFASEVNLIILDEPTNFLDIYSMEAVENALKLYEGTVLFVSHDRKLISSTADRIMAIEDCSIKTFNGSYEEYLESKREVKLSKAEERYKMKLVLETRLSEVLGRLSMPGKEDDIQALDLEYKDLLKKIKEIE
jgi:macrolide transport system ATP-binding/permease protein